MAHVRTCRFRVKVLNWGGSLPGKGTFEGLGFMKPNTLNPKSSSAPRETTPETLGLGLGPRSDLFVLVQTLVILKDEMGMTRCDTTRVENKTCAYTRK